MVKTNGGVEFHYPGGATKPPTPRPSSVLTSTFDLYAQLKGLKVKANLSVAEVLKGGPLVSEVHHAGSMGGLDESYAIACEDSRWQLEKGDVP